jgi:hypothetical protein
MRSRRLRILAITVVLALVVVPAAQAGRKRPKPKPPTRVERTDSGTYAAPAGAFVANVDATGCVNVQGDNCLTFESLVGETFVSLSAADNTGTPTPLKVTINGQDFFFCGGTDSPLAITEYSTIEVVALVADVPAGPPNCQGAGSTGMVTAVFSNLP